MFLKSLMFASCMFWTCAAQAQVDCGGPPSDIPPDIRETLEGDIQGKAELFTRLLGATSTSQEK